MRLLLDTHVLVWWWQDDPRLGGAPRRMIADPAVKVLVSAVSAWEIAIKSTLGKLRLDGDVEEQVDLAGFGKLPIGFGHAAEAARLPPHHEDPFDRMLIAQARCEGLTLVTADRRMEPYSVAVLWT
ncbi:MAG: type II toxin-antitoxin system VapC family toxin [Magnetospirillum sp. WYHS-4]